jgi:hypothetical protein
MTFLGEWTLRALDVAGSALAILFAFVIALYVIVWGAAFIKAALFPYQPPKQMQPRCPECGSPKWIGKPGDKVCDNCGAQEHWL